MKHHSKLWFVFGLTLLLMPLGATATAQEWTDWQGPDGGARIRAGLLDREQNAGRHSASVEVEVQNVCLDYPNAFAQPSVRVGVLQYQIDQCPSILATDTRLRFQNLPGGNHVITVRLLGTNGQLLAPETKLTLAIP